MILHVTESLQYVCHVVRHHLDHQTVLHDRTLGCQVGRRLESSIEDNKAGTSQLPFLREECDDVRETVETDLVTDVDGLGLVTPILLLDGHQVTVSRHTQVGPQCQHRLVTRVQSLQNRLVPAEKGNNQ